MIQIGTAGYSYADWVGPFYPPGTKRPEMLSFYTRYFSIAELDFTYYQMPGVKTMAGLAAKSPAEFRFTVKANRQMTHIPETAPEELAELCRAFLTAMAPLREAGKLSCLLLQFPFAFQKNQANWERLLTLRDHLAVVPLVVEFRHISWVNQATFDRLRKEQLNFCCVDEPELPGLFPPLAVATGPLGYLRFHGRNKAKWWNHSEAGERYDYLYSGEELREWLPKLKSLTENTNETLVFFNNCHFGQAARNALEMQGMLFGDE
jgi:uncharacterized protein YecE (DUF72 family)